MKYNDKAMETRVLQKTVELLQKNGIRGWNMDELSLQSGLSKNTLYRIIGSKEDLMERIVTTYYQEIYSCLTEILGKADDYVYTFKRLIRVYSDLSPAYFSEILNEYPSIEQKIATRYSTVRQRLIDYIRRGVEEGYLREDLNVEKTFELLRSVSLIYDNKFSEQERAERIHFAFECIIYGIVRR